MATQRVKAMVTIAHRPASDLSKVVQGPPGAEGGIEIQGERWITIDENGTVLSIEELEGDGVTQ